MPNVVVKMKMSPTQAGKLYMEKCALEDENEKLKDALTEISNMCVGEIALGADLDAAEIGEMIYVATGLTNPQLNAK